MCTYGSASIPRLIAKESETRMGIVVSRTDAFD